MDNLDNYISAFSSAEDDLLKELNRVTHQRMIHSRMISGHMQGKFLEMLIRMLNPASVLEIGAFTGYSALCMAAGLDDEAHLDTIEVDDELEELINSFLERSEHGHKVKLHIGSALEVAPRLNDVYDFVFIDGDKREYPDYYRMLMGDGNTPPLVKVGSYMLADNILWYGKVAEPEKYMDPHTIAIREFNKLIREDSRVENVIIPIRDGLNLIRVK